MQQLKNLRERRIEESNKIQAIKFIVFYLFIYFLPLKNKIIVDFVYLLLTIDLFVYFLILK